VRVDKDGILAVIVNQVRTVVPDLSGRAIGAADSMADLGVDSIERGEIILATMEELGLDIPLVQLHGPRNLGELAALVHARLGG
jgi:polyketide biosynthesis acyl carrier protein